MISLSIEIESPVIGTGSEVSAPRPGVRWIAWSLAAISLLAIFRAPAYPLWVISIFVTEGGHLLALVLLAGLLVRPRTGPILLALWLLLTPLFRSLPVAAYLPEKLAQAFGTIEPRATANAPARLDPLVPWDLLAGIYSPATQRQTFTYATPSGLPLNMDVYSDGKPGGHPAVLVVHSGSWASGDRSEMPALNQYLAARGYLLIAIDYRLVPTARFPAPIEDVSAALAYLKTHAPSLGFDGKNVVLLGRSAGGQVALFSAYTLHDPIIRGVVGFYSPSDMVFAYSRAGNPLLMNSRRVLRNYVGSTTYPDDFRKASPLEFAGPHSPPTLLIHGTRDEMVWVNHSEHLCERLRALGRPVYFLKLPWATHAADYIFRGPSGQISTYAVERFLANVMPPDDFQRRSR